MEWSQRSITAKAMGEFAHRYPDPNLRILIDIISQNEKQNVLPPDLEEVAKKASNRLDQGKSGIDAALNEVMQGVMLSTPLELALSTVGNLCLAGAPLPGFKEQMAVYRETLIG